MNDLIRAKRNVFVIGDVTVIMASGSSTQYVFNAMSEKDLGNGTIVDRPRLVSISPMAISIRSACPLYW